MKPAARFDVFPYVLVAPALLLTLTFTIYPIFYAIQISFFKVKMVNIGAFVGLANYSFVLGDTRTAVDVVNSFAFTFGSMAGTMLFGLFFAVILNERVRGRTVFRAGLLVPWVVTEIVSMMLVKWMLHYDAGLVNFLIALFGGRRVDFLGSVQFALVTVIAANIWRGFAFTMIIILAGMQSIPESIFEAATLDGITFLRKVFSIIIPLIKGPLLVNIVITTISYFNRVTPILVLTGGGPVTATETLGLRMYLEAFSYLRMADASVFGVLILVINLVLILIYTRVIKMESYYLGQPVKKTSLLEWLFQAILLVATLVAVVPFLWALSTSFKTDAQAFRMPPEWIPAPAILDNFRRVIVGGIVGASVNSATVTIATIVTSLFLALLAGYSISRLRWKGSNIALILLIGPQMLPGIINLVPIYMMMSKLRMLNNLPALILIYSAQNIPLSVWLLKSYFDSIPWSIEDAAIIDGCTKPQRLFYVMVPLSQPGLAAAGIFVFMNSWNEFLTASTLISGKARFTIPLVVYSFIRDYMIDWTGLMAAAWFAAVPIIIVFVILQRRFISGLSSGIGKE